jgi:phosphoenolpyruvate carboxylase
MFDHPGQGKSETRRQHLSAAFDIAASLMDGRQELTALADDLSARGKRCLDGRLGALSRQWTSISRADNEGRMAALIRGFAAGEGDGLLPFDVFRQKIEDEVAGLVITAHPTFSMSDSA